METAKNRKHLIAIATFALATIAAYFWFIRQPAFQVTVEWASRNFATYVLLLVLVKILAIVWPPLPGGAFTVGSIPVIGWLPAYLADTIGGLTGSSIAYALGKRYGYRFLEKLFDEATIEKIRSIRIKAGRELEAMILVRTFTGIITEAVSYGSGLIGVRFGNFLIASVIGSIVTLPVFYLASGIFSGRNVIVNVVVLGTAAVLFLKLKGRYLE